LLPTGSLLERGGSPLFFNQTWPSWASFTQLEDGAHGRHHSSVVLVLVVVVSHSQGGEEVAAAFPLIAKTRFRGHLLASLPPINLLVLGLRRGSWRTHRGLLRSPLVVVTRASCFGFGMASRLSHLPLFVLVSPAFWPAGNTT
jgi:hypothetical protein